MKRALIGPAPALTINDIVATVDDEFPVHPDLQWVDAPDDVSPVLYEYDGTGFVLKVPPPPTRPEDTPATADDVARALRTLLSDKALVTGTEFDTALTDAKLTRS